MKDAHVCSNFDGNTRRGWISSELDVLLASDNAFSLLSYSLVHQYEVFELENNYHPKLNEYIQLFFPMAAHICRVMFLTNRTPWTCFCMFFRNMGGVSVTMWPQNKAFTMAMGSQVRSKSPLRRWWRKSTSSGSNGSGMCVSGRKSWGPDSGLQMDVNGLYPSYLWSIPTFDGGL